MTSKHYHVVENTPGYLPESEPTMFTNKREAHAYAWYLARDCAESLTGSHRGISGKAGDYDIDDGSLGRVVETIECQETDCG